MRELSLFTGIGGGLLGSLILGWRTVAAVEYDAYCQRLLCARGGYVADREGDGVEGMRAAGKQEPAASIEAEIPGRDGVRGRGFPIFPDVRTFDGTAWRGKVDIVTGGFPCQPHSQAGKRLGGKDDRDLWPDTVRVLRESGAPLGFFENVPGLLTSRDADGLPMFGRILGDLSEAGFDAEWCVLGADDVGAPHRRKRLWILAYRIDDWAGRRQQLAQGGEGAGDVAYRDGGRCEQCDAGVGTVPEPDPCSPWRIDPADVGDPGQGVCGRRSDKSGRGSEKRTAAGRAGEGESRSGVCDPESGRQPVRRPSPQSADERHAVCPDGDGHELDPWLAEPYVGRVATGIPSRVDRLRGLGNAQVPQCMARAFTILARDAGVLR